MTDLPFWSDDFDMDLPKVIPNARDIVGDLADVELWTTGGTTHGRLNHPSVWNGDRAMVAFFGFANDARPGPFWSDRPLVQCTVWEAFRDAWPHSYALNVEGREVWNTFAFQVEFEAIMWVTRGWGHRTEAERAQAVKKVQLSLAQARQRLQDVCRHHGKLPA